MSGNVYSNSNQFSVILHTSFILMLLYCKYNITNIFSNPIGIDMTLYIVIYYVSRVR
jgi:hypothetical protein